MYLLWHVTLKIHYVQQPSHIQELLQMIKCALFETGVRVVNQYYTAGVVVRFQNSKEENGIRYLETRKPLTGNLLRR